MRACGHLVWFLVTGCMSSGSSTGTSVPDRTDTLSCDTAIPTYCAAATLCDLTLDDAQHDKRLCSPGFAGAVVRCGDYDVVVKSEIDTSMEYFYRDGALTAVVSRVDVLPKRCFGGPSSFDAPSCPRAQGTPLAACSGN